MSDSDKKNINRDLSTFDFYVKESVEMMKPLYVYSKNKIDDFNSSSAPLDLALEVGGVESSQHLGLGLGQSENATKNEKMSPKSKNKQLL